MSHLSRFGNPSEFADHPTLEPEVKCAILAPWGQERIDTEDWPARRIAAGAAVPRGSTICSSRRVLSVAVSHPDAEEARHE